VNHMLTRRQGLAALATPIMLENKYSIIDPHVHVWKHDPRYPWAKPIARPPEKDATPEMLLELMRAKVSRGR
jgi:predicted TIM-barrel fold metal-dependent hydrolase